MTDTPVPLSEQQTADKVRLDMIRDGEWDQASELELESEQWPFGNVGFLIRLVDEAREERDATLQQNERVMAILRRFKKIVSRSNGIIECVNCSDAADLFDLIKELAILDDAMGEHNA